MLNIISCLFCFIYTCEIFHYYLLIVQAKIYIGVIDKACPRDGLPWWLELTCQWRRHRFNPWVRRNPLEKEMANHSSILNGQMSLAGSTGSQRVRHDWVRTRAHTHTLPGIGKYNIKESELPFRNIVSLCVWEEYGKNMLQNQLITRYFW